MAKVGTPSPIDERDASCPVRYASVGKLKVAFHVDGPEDAPVVVVLHGGQMTRRTWILPSAPTNVRLVAITRPGYDESGDANLHTYGYHVFVSCVVAVLDSLKVQKFHVVGHSSGGPNALACKALLPDRCMRCVVLSGDSEYATNPQINTADLGCCTPGRCCGRCALCCLLPCLCRTIEGTCCSCSAPRKRPHKKEASKQMLGILKPAELAEIEKLGDLGKEWWAFQEKVMGDSTCNATRLNGLKADLILQNKPWPFKAKLTEETFIGDDVEFWVGELDDTVKPAISQYSHTLVPGSTLYKVPELGHQGMYFPAFITQRYASLAAGIAAPEQQSMDSA